MELRIGTELKRGDYRILGILGQGGFGITYLAEQTALGRKVAIKEFFMKDLCNRDNNTSHVSVGSVGSKELVERFRQKFLKEARSIASLEHKHIVPVIDVFEENGTAYYVMKYFGGGSLSACTALSEEKALRYIRQIASAIGFIHGRHMMHLDIKPGNILLDSEDNAIVIDFGLAKQYDEAGHQTSTTPVGISHGYAPLEQYKAGGVSSFSPATDIYSLGATLYRLLTDNRPADAMDLVSAPFPACPANVSASTWNAVKSAMQPAISSRPQSVEEFLGLVESGKCNDERAKSKDESGKCKDATSIFGNASSDKTLLPTGNNQNIASNKLSTRTFRANGVEFTMVAVEGGTFSMGSNDGWSDEKPIHQVTLDSYCIGQTEVTQALWQAVMGSSPSRFKGTSNPVEQVSYNDCIDFINQLNTLLKDQLPQGRKFRLPTEAEWEYAARGGNKSKGYKYSGSNSKSTVAWYDDNSGRTTHPVKQKACNELGLYDMSGNVWEWCSDWYDDYSSSPQNNPKGLGSGSCRVLRGGSWFNYEQSCRSANRHCSGPGGRSSNCGLRLAF